MKKLLIVLMTAATLFIVSCTGNIRSKQFGGTSTLNLPKGQKLVMVTWKEASLWYLTKPMTLKDSVETYTFEEESSYGILNGKVIIHETR